MSFDRIGNCRCSTQRAASTHIRARNSQSFFVCSLAAKSIFLISSFDAAFAHSCSLSLLKNFFLFFFSREDLKTASRCCCSVLRVYNVPACCLMICIKEKKHAGKKSSRKKMKNKLAELGKIFWATEKRGAIEKRDVHDQMLLQQKKNVCFVLSGKGRDLMIEVSCPTGKIFISGISLWQKLCTNFFSSLCLSRRWGLALMHSLDPFFIVPHNFISFFFAFFVWNTFLATIHR